MCFSRLSCLCVIELLTEDSFPVVFVSLFSHASGVREAPIFLALFSSSASSTAPFASRSFPAIRPAPPSRAYQLQPCAGSHQDSPQVQSRQHFRGCGNVVDASQRSSCAGESGLSSLECGDQSHLPANCSWIGRPPNLLFPGERPFRHDVGRASRRRVLEVFLGYPLREYSLSAWVARLLASCGFGGLCITTAVTSSCQFRSRTVPALLCSFNVLTCLGFQVRERASVRIPITSKCRPCLATLELCAEPSHGR